MDDIENVYDKDTACQVPCCLDVNFTHQPEDVHESKVKDTYRHCKGPSINKLVPTLSQDLFVHLSTKSFVPPVKVTNVRTIADVQP